MIPFGGIGKVLLQVAAIHIPMIFLAYNGFVSPQLVAIPAAILTFLLCLWYWKSTDSETPFYESDIFYAGLLSGAMVWMMYFFA